MVLVFKYALTYYNDSQEENQEDLGIVLAETYHEAVERLENYYGGDLVSINFLEKYDCGGDYVIPTEIHLLKTWT